MGQKALNIVWDIDDDDNDYDEEELDLPNEIEIPDEIADDEDAISDYISDVTGFCHCGFELTREIDAE